MKERIAEAVVKIHDAHGRTAKASIIAHWVTKLMPYIDMPELWTILDTACDGARFPALSEVLGSLSLSASRTTFVAPPPLSEKQKEDALKAATISMLWLYYVMGWKPENFTGTIFSKITGIDESPREFIERETKKYSKEQVIKWMQQK